MRTFRFPSRSSSQLRRALIGDEKSPIFPAKGNRHEKALPHSHSVRASELECVLKCPRRRCAGDPIPRIGGTVLRGRSSVRQCAAAVGCPDSSDGVTVLRPQTWWSVPSCPRACPRQRCQTTRRHANVFGTPVHSPMLATSIAPLCHFLSGRGCESPSGSRRPSAVGD